MSQRPAGKIQSPENSTAEASRTHTPRRGQSIHEILSARLASLRPHQAAISCTWAH